MKKLSEEEIGKIQQILIGLCTALDMEFAVLVMQHKNGPLEISRVSSDPSWNDTTREISRRIQEFAKETRSHIDN